MNNYVTVFQPVGGIAKLLPYVSELQITSIITHSLGNVVFNNTGDDYDFTITGQFGPAFNYDAGTENFTMNGNFIQGAGGIVTFNNNQGDTTITIRDKTANDAYVFQTGVGAGLGTHVFTGKVGVGVSPSNSLHIVLNSASTTHNDFSTGNYLLRLENQQTNNSDNIHVGLGFRLQNGIANKNLYITAINNATNTGADLAFAISKSGSEYERMRITCNGKLGISNNSLALSANTLTATSFDYATQACAIYSSSATGATLFRGLSTAAAAVNESGLTITGIRETEGNAAGIAPLSLNCYIVSGAALAAISNNRTMINIRNNGNTVAVFNSDGTTTACRLGIGTASPTVKIHTQGASNTGEVILIENTSNTASKTAQLQIKVAGTSADDPFIQFINGSTTTWAMGQDNSATDSFKISYAAAGSNVLGTGDALEINSSLSTIHYGRHQQKQGADVASANNLALGTDGNCFEITGAVEIQLIDIAGWQNGSMITLFFSGAPTVKHATATSGNNTTILLASSVDFSATAGDVLTLRLSEIGGVQAWREQSITTI